MRRKKHRRTEAKTGKGVGKGSQLVIIIVAAVPAAIPFCYGKYFEFGTNGPFDGSLNIYSATSVVNGQKIGAGDCFGDSQRKMEGSAVVIEPSIFEYH